MENAQQGPVPLGGYCAGLPPNRPLSIGPAARCEKKMIVRFGPEADTFTVDHLGDGKRLLSPISGSLPPRNRQSQCCCQIGLLIEGEQSKPLICK